MCLSLSPIEFSNDTMNKGDLNSDEAKKKKHDLMEHSAVVSI